MSGIITGDKAGFGWDSDMPTFESSSIDTVTSRLSYFVNDASKEQLAAWRKDIPWLQREFGSYLLACPVASKDWTVLEYELPREFRRPDVIVLKNGCVVVLELKGCLHPTQAALDQVSAYARDLRAYHSYCRNKEVIPVLITRGGADVPANRDDVLVIGPHGLGQLLSRMATANPAVPIRADEFLAADAYQPLPTIVAAARALFHKRSLPWIERARADTEPALDYIANVSRYAASTKTRHLVLLTGVPGAGKTLVGLQLVHSGWLDEIAVAREKGKPTSPAVYLTGNGPLVDVLQDSLKTEGASGSVFVQAIKKYISSHIKRPGLVPPEHLVVFDEAQRAHDADHHAAVHKLSGTGKSEPENLLEICARIPDWSVIVALVGTGQAIHVGEEGGIPLWAEAIAAQESNAQWHVHGPVGTRSVFEGIASTLEESPLLSLDTEIRFHLAPRLHDFVEGILAYSSPATLEVFATELFSGGYRFLLTRDLDEAKRYLVERYADAPNARYGILASSKDKILGDFGVDNSYQTTKRLKVGPWYNADPSDPRSCCQLETVATEFSSQGLELDAALFAWGCDLRVNNSSWTMDMSRGTKKPVKDPLQMRKNVYRVLLTRGRDATVVFVPRHEALHATYKWLIACGFRELSPENS
jgi:hypothetical protein